MNWTLCCENRIVAIVSKFQSGLEQVYLSPNYPDHLDMLQREIPSTLSQTKYIVDNKLKIKLADQDIYVKIETISTNWILIANIHDKYEQYSNIVEASTINKGEVEEEFEIALDSKTSQIKLVNESMSDYKNCYENLIRRINFKLNKITIPSEIGAVYITEHSSFVYLGQVFYQKSTDKGMNINQFYPGKFTQGHLIIHLNALDKQQSVSEIFKTKIIGRDLEKNIIWVSNKELPAGCKTKQKLCTKDSILVEDYREYLIDNTIKSIQSSIDLNGRNINQLYSSWNKQHTVYETVLYVSNKVVQIPNPICLEKLIKFTEQQLWICIIENWNKVTNSSLVPSDNSGIKNKENLMTLFTKSISKYSINLYKFNYYRQLLDYLIPNLNELVENSLKKWQNYDPFGNLTNYIESGIRYSNERQISNLLKESSNCLDVELFPVYKFKLGLPNEVISDLPSYNSMFEVFDDPLAVELPRFLVELGKLAIDTQAEIIHQVIKFNSIRRGKTKSIEHFRLEITICDIIKYYKGVLNIPKILIDDILTYKFTSVSFYVENSVLIK